ncbi:MAG TPA: hypothetical protein VJV05_00735 [Pyrinomonadaceae bacterium]|nr:hypothetical protein [Pyrinomonadaceae bacterium]
MSNRRTILFLVAVAFLGTACGSPGDTTNTTSPNATEVSKSGGGKVEATPTATPLNSNAACYTVDTGKSALLKSQTFAIDFEPFKNSCFVTTHDPDFTDPPLNSEIAIYKDGKILPKAFQNGPPGEPDIDEGSTGFPTSGCWVVAVAFQDVNGDRFTDVILVGKCGAKMGDYNENLVYLNNGKVLFTRPNVNVNLTDFKSIGEVVKYTKDNPRLFSIDH